MLRPANRAPGTGIFRSGRRVFCDLYGRYGPGAAKGGATARVLQILAIYTGGRLLIMMLNSIPAFRADALISALIQTVWQGFPFVFTLAAAYRWQITETARTAVAECGREAGAAVSR